MGKMLSIGKFTTAPWAALREGSKEAFILTESLNSNGKVLID
jgi:hypothetical protein